MSWRELKELFEVDDAKTRYSVCFVAVKGIATIEEPDAANIA